MATRASLIDQLRGATKLAVHATREVALVVEEMHHTIGGGPALLGSPLRGLSELVNGPTYGAIRGVTNVVGAGLDAAFAQLAPVVERAGAERGVVLAALNGVVGDYLAESGNPLAIELTLLHGGESLQPAPELLRTRVPPGGRLLVLLHGSSVDESSWLRNGHDHGQALAAERGYVPLYLRYNSGLHVSQNGRALALHLEQLLAAWPHPVEELAFLAHSMGGLVARSAAHVGETEGHAWRTKLKRLVTLGTPHHGAPLERSGNWADLLLKGNSYTAPIARLARLRSAGVTDLRFGNVHDAHWEGRDRFEHGKDPRGAVSLPSGLDCFAIAATSSPTLTDDPKGDGLVPVDSALGKHPEPEKTLGIPADRQFVLTGASHLDLLDRREVYEKLLAWL